MLELWRKSTKMWRSLLLLFCQGTEPTHKKRSFVIAANIYLKEACNVNSFSFVEMDSGLIVGSSLIMLLFKNDHLHLAKFGYEKLSLLFLSQLNSVLEKNSWISTRTTSCLQLQINGILHLKQRSVSTIIICLQSNGIIYWYR